MQTRLLIAGDLHCGHKLGMWPSYRIDPDFKLSALMNEYWQWWKQETKGHWDIAFWGGDLIDGDGKKDASHLWLAGVDDQKELAIDIIKEIGADQNIFCYGSGYHVGQNQDHEKNIADEFGGDIQTYQKIAIQGIKFHLSHVAGKSGTPTGGDISVKKEMLWALLENMDDVDFVIRWHIHEYRRLELDFITGITCPALKIGDPNFDRYARKIRGWYTVGFLEMIIENEKVVDFIKHFFKYKIKGEFKELWMEKN